MCKTVEIIGGPVKRVYQNRTTIEKKWSGTGGTDRTYPKEQENIPQKLVHYILKYRKGITCEIGCGTGRIAKFFKPDKYIGIDINNTSIIKAQRKLPQHTFKHIGWSDNYPKTLTYLFYSVAYHIPDNEIAGIISRLKHNVIIIEQMGAWQRDYGRDNNYFRDPSTFRKLFAQINMKEIAFIRCFDTNYPIEMDMQIFK